MKEIKVPHVGVNDEFVTLTEIIAEDLEEVEIGDIVCTVETSKAVADIEAEEIGIVKFVAKPGEQINVGDTLYYLLDNVEEAANIGKESADLDISINATKKAIDFAKEHNVDLSKIHSKTIIKKRDIIQYLETAGSVNSVKTPGIEEWSKKLGTKIQNVKELSTIQKQIAFNLQSVQQNVVASYFTVKIPSQKLNELIIEYKEKFSKIITYTELAIFCLRHLLKEYKLMNAFLKDNKIIFYEEVNIGFTVDLNDRLIVPVIKNSDQKTFEDIAKETNVMRMSAMMGKINTQELMGGTFTISNLMDGNMLFFMPIINVYQSAILGISGNIELNEGKKENYVYLTLGMDHRFINGKYASNFLNDLKNDMLKLNINVFGN